MVVDVIIKTETLLMLTVLEAASRNIFEVEKFKSESNEMLPQIWISVITALKRSAP
jgi:hypothetical protein